jgi:hypothetical protein
MFSIFFFHDSLLEELNKLIQLVIKIQHVLNGTIQSILSELKQSRSCIHGGIYLGANRCHISPVFQKLNIAADYTLISPAAVLSTRKQTTDAPNVIIMI